jgi:hypothetical protein
MAARTNGPDDAAEERRRGRKHNEIHGFGPAAGWARLLRAELHRAGTPSRRDMARHGYFSSTMMSATDNGRTIPSWHLSEAYLRGCEVPDEDLADWRWRYAEH